jgi:hypothetical protein
MREAEEASRVPPDEVVYGKAFAHPTDSEPEPEPEQEAVEAAPSESELIQSLASTSRRRSRS